MKVLLIGATGATGMFVLKHLIEDVRIHEIVIFVRKTAKVKSDKVKEVLVDFDKLHDYKDLMRGDVAISCLGSTLKQAGSQEKQWIVDHDYQLEFAKIAKENNVSHFILLSAMGVSETSKVFYNRMKGTLETAVKGLQFSRLDLVQPGMLIRPNTDRMGEKFAEKVLTFLNAIGIFKSYQPIKVEDLAWVIKELVFETDLGIFTIKLDAIFERLQKKK